MRWRFLRPFGGHMSVSIVNALNHASFVQRTVKPAISNTAGLSAGSSEGVATQAQLSSPNAQAQTALPTLDGSGTPEHAKTRDADDKIIAAWFKLMKPHAGNHSHFAENERKKDDPGRVPDPLYEPTKVTVPDSLKIITFNDLMRAMAPKKPHWKHYDDVSNQFQVGSHERD